MHALLDNLPANPRTKLRTVRANGIEIRTESFGDADRPAVLMIPGGNTSMIGYPDALCRRIADAGHFVIRYDNRDTGQSTTFTPGAPGYTVADLADDAIGVLDAYGIDKTHGVGFSMGGMVVQHLAIFRGDRLLTASIGGSSPEPLGASPARIPEADRLPLPLLKVMKIGERLAQVDWTDECAALEGAMLEHGTLLGSGDDFDEDAIRTLVLREITRARSVPCLRLNHGIAVAATPRWRSRLKEVAVPTLVLHGSDDPLLPVEHGAAIAREIPGATLMVIQGMGHMLAPNSPMWVHAGNAIVAHTAAG